MGFATNNCGKAPINFNKDHTDLYFQCQYGFGVTEVLSSGFLDTDNPENDGINKCYVEEDVDSTLHPEMRNFNKDEFNKKVLEKCEGK